MKIVTRLAAAPMKIVTRLATAASLVVALCGVQRASAADAFTLSSSTFTDGGAMPTRTGGVKKDNPNCLGENVSPQLQWSNPPAGTKSYAIIVVDPEGRGGLGVDHWVAYGIPASISSFTGGEVSAISGKYVGGSGNNGQANYSGPCPPAGAPHHYVFTLIATDLDPGALPAGLTHQQLLDKLEGHAKGATGLVGLYAHP